MDESIITLISNVGFPIVAFLLMFRLTNSTIKENTNTLMKLTEQIKTIIK